MKAMIVEDSDFVRAVWREMLAKIAGISLVGEFRRASSAIAGIRRSPPDIILLDIHLQDSSGMDVLKVVGSEYPEIKVLVVTNFADPVCRNRYARAGAYGFFDKSQEIKALFGALKNLVGFKTPSVQCPGA